MNKEIEVKFQVPEPERTLIQKWVQDNAQHVSTADSVDYYLDNPEHSFFFINKKNYHDALSFLRIRITPTKHFLCLKKRVLDTHERTKYCEEYEIPIEDGTKTLALFEQLGYIKKITINKHRASYVFKHQDILFELSFDTIKNLGTFIEVELKTPVQDPVMGKQIIYTVIKSMGLTKIKSYLLGYVSIMLNPTHDFSEIITL
jgi:predicted adenylyl cyclase CyaB